MPRISPAQAVTFKGFQGGLNKDADVTRLEDNETPEALNVVLGLRGEVIKRVGYTRFDSGLTEASTHLISWKDSSQRNWLVAIDVSGDIFYVQDSGATFTDSGKDMGSGGSASRHPIAWAVANGSLYISSKRNVSTHKWTGSAWSTITTVPQCQFMTWRFEQLFVANLLNAPSQLQVSLEGNPEDFTTEPAAFGFDPDDGDEIRAMAPSGDDLLIFKDHSIHIFSGKVRSDFQRYKLDSLRGTYSPRTVKQVRGLLIFLDRDTGVWSWDGSQFTLISEKINRYLLDNMTYNFAYTAVGHVRRDSYYLSVPWQGSSTNQRTFVYSTLTNSWTEWDYGLWDAVNHVNRELIGGPRGNVGVWEAIGSSDGGNPIPVVFKTPWMRPAGLGGLSRLRRVESVFKKTQSAVDIKMRQDYDDEVLLTRSFLADNINKASESDVLVALDGWPGRADAFQLEIASSDELPLQINLVEALYSVNRDRYGETTVAASS